MAEKKSEPDYENYFSNMSMDMLIRGDDITDLGKLSLDWCREFIAGSWLNATTVDDITCTRLQGGLTNQLYKIELKPHVKRIRNKVYNDEPDSVAIKIYQKKHFVNFHKDESERLTDTIILTALSAIDVCPKVYGIFQNGFIQEFFEHELFGSEAQADSELLEKALFKIAQTHSLKVPIRKCVDTLFSQMRGYVKTIYEETEFQTAIHELKLQRLIDNDLATEIQSIERIWNQFDFPPKFCHMDLMGSNILVSKKKRDIKIIDFEYSTFSCRGYDISTMLGQWGIEPFQYEKIQLPQDDVIDRIVTLYRQQCELVEPGYCQLPENSHEQIMVEVKICFCVYSLFFTAFFMQMKPTEMDKIHPDFTETLYLVELMYNRYIQIRARLISDGIVDKDMNLLKNNKFNSN